MSEPIMKTHMTNQEVMIIVQKCYGSFLSAHFFLRTIKSIRRIDDMKHLIFVAFKFFSKLLDFTPPVVKRTAL